MFLNIRAKQRNYTRYHAAVEPAIVRGRTVAMQWGTKCDCAGHETTSKNGRLPIGAVGDGDNIWLNWGESVEKRLNFHS
jgi:hypothetical protein